MAPVLRDLRSAGITAPSVGDHDWADDPETSSVMLWSPGWGGTGVYVSRDAPECERIAMIADQVQEWAIEELWGGDFPTNWPPCPRHPRSHPMKASTHTARAVWICPTDDAVMASIGAL